MSHYCCSSRNNSKKTVMHYRNKKKELGKSRDKMKETNEKNSYAVFQLVANSLYSLLHTVPL